MSPAVQDDGRDVAPGIATGVREHGGELLANALFVFAEGSAQHFGAAATALLISGKPRRGIQDF
jgi:hypothetical protein